MNVTPPDPRNIIGQVPGRLCVAPTDLSADFPHGGTRIGNVDAEATLIREAPVQPLTAEEWGNEVYEVISGGETWSFAARLKEWNVAGYTRFFLNASAGDTSQRAYVEAPGDNRAGYRYSSRAAVWCFSPLAQDTHAFVLFYNALPMVEEAAEMLLRRGPGGNLEVPVVLVATRDSSDRILAWGSRKDIALP